MSIRSANRDISAAAESSVGSPFFEGTASSVCLRSIRGGKLVGKMSFDRLLLNREALDDLTGAEVLTGIEDLIGIDALGSVDISTG